MNTEQTKKGRTARRHHFVPRCWLAGFTGSGEKSGVLWVTDLHEQRQWESSPNGTGFEQDFYRLNDPSVNPMAAENALGMVEDLTAPVLHELFRSPRFPSERDLEKLIWFMALQYVRVPAFRPWMLGLERKRFQEWFTNAIAEPETWKAKLVAAGISADLPEASFERMLKFKDDITGGGRYDISAPNDWYIHKGFDAASRLIVPALKQRYWHAIISPSGSFIGSDSPVGMDGHEASQVGFVTADVVCFPVNKHLSLVGAKRLGRFPLAASRNLIAHQNTFTMLSAGRRVYSDAPDFCWKDHRTEYQTDFKLFSKELVLSGGRENFF